MDKIDELIDLKGNSYSHYDDSDRVYIYEDQIFIFGSNHVSFGSYICTVGEYKERLNQRSGCYGDGKRGGVIGRADHKQQLIKLIKSIDSDDAASIANVILRNGWVKK